MLKTTSLLGTACVAAAALVAGPAFADTLQGFAGFADAQYTHATFSHSSGDANAAQFGVGGALPITDIPNLNVQVDGSYAHGWTDDNHSQEIWNFGFSPFLAYGGSRWGLNLNYENTTGGCSNGCGGHVTNGGAFMEWYLNDQISLMAKGGYLSSGGTPQGGHGHYLGGGAVFYAMPDLAITAFIDWNDIVTGGSNVSFPGGCLHCQLDVNGVTYSIDAEWLPVEDIGISVFAGFAYQQLNEFGFDDNESIWHIGFRYYLGSKSLQMNHRDGNLNAHLRGS